MIQPIKNLNLTFKGSQNDDLGYSDIAKIFAARDQKRAAEEHIKTQQQREQTQRRRPQEPQRRYNKYGDSYENRTTHSSKTRSHKKSKKSSAATPVALSVSLLAALGLIGAGTMSGNSKPEAKDPVSTAIISQTHLNQSAPLQGIEGQTISLIEDVPDNVQNILDAVDTIKSNPGLKKTYFDMLETIKNMQEICGNDVIETIQNILLEPYAKGVDIELVLPQIFCESSGKHFDDDGTVNISYANCNGFMQLSKDAEHDMNARYFSDSPLNRDVPIDNLKLGIAYDHELLNNYFDGDKFLSLAAYNAGATNVANGKDYGDEYAHKILGYYQVLKDNPDFTKMLLDGDFSEFRDEFLY